MRLPTVVQNMSTSRNDDRELYRIIAIRFQFWIIESESLSTHPRKRHFDAETFYDNPFVDSRIITT